MAAERERQPYAMTVDRQESLPDECQQKEQSDVRNSASMAELLGLMHLSINNEARVERSGGRMVPSKEVKCHFQTSTVFADRRPWVPEGVFHLKKLPQELRMKIYAHELYHLPVSKEPALLQVLAKDKFLLDDYRRAIRLWEYGGMHNFKVTSANVDTFHRMPMKDMMKIKHLTIVVDAPGAPLKYGNKMDVFFKLKSNKSQLKNNFESIIIDLCQHDFETLPSENRRPYFVKFAENCVRGSSRPYRVIFRLPKNRYRFSTYPIDRLDLLPYLVIKPTDDNSSYLWIWDGGDRMMKKVRG